MPELEPAYYEAIDDVIEERKGNADWDPEELRSALLKVAKGEAKQSDIVEDKDFSQSMLSKRWSDVKDRREEIKRRMEESSELFRDPTEEAVEAFRDFFDEIDNKYDMGINDMTIRMMVDEIRETEQLPAPMYVRNFLKNTRSGIGAETTLDYISRRYKQWLSRFQQQNSSVAGGPQQMSEPSGQYVGGQQSPGQPRRGRDGVPIGGGVPSGQSAPQHGGQMAQGQQPHQQAPTQPQHPTHPPGQSDSGGSERLKELEEKIDYLAQEVMEGGSSAGGEVTIETDDGDVMRVPADSPLVDKYMGSASEDDDESFLDQLAKAKEAGIIDDGDDGQSMVEQIQMFKELGLIDDGSDEAFAEHISEAIEKLGQSQVQAQQQMSSNFQSVLQQMQEQEEDGDEELTAEDVQQIINDTLKEDEVDRLESQISELREEMKNPARNNPKMDTEYMKKDREMDYREKQLETMNENLRVLPTQMAAAIREGFVPAVKELNMGEGGNPFWSPPSQHREPKYRPRPPREEEGRKPAPVSDPEEEGPDVEPEPPREAVEEEDESSGDEEYADTVRERIGLDVGAGEEAVDDGEEDSDGQMGDETEVSEEVTA